MTAPRPRLIHAGVSSEVILNCPAGHELVRQCYPLKRSQGRERNETVEPFPTLFWLTCTSVVQQISRLEHGGAIQWLQQHIQSDATFRSRVHQDHRAYIARRHQALRADDIACVRLEPWWTKFQSRGIGGIENWDAVKCLHLHYAHHLALGSTIGRWIDDHASIEKCHGQNTEVQPTSQT